MTASVIRMGRYGHLSVRALGLGQDESWLAPNAQLHHGHRERLVRWLSCSRMIETSPPRPLHMATAERAPGQGGCDGTRGSPASSRASRQSSRSWRRRASTGIASREMSIVFDVYALEVRFLMWQDNAPLPLDNQSRGNQALTVALGVVDSLGCEC